MERYVCVCVCGLACTLGERGAWLGRPETKAENCLRKTHFHTYAHSTGGIDWIDASGRRDVKRMEREKEWEKKHDPNTSTNSHTWFNDALITFNMNCQYSGGGSCKKWHYKTIMQFVHSLPLLIYRHTHTNSERWLYSNNTTCVCVRVNKTNRTAMP